MGFFDNLFSGADPARSAQLRGGLLGAARAISQPYGNIGSAFVGAGLGAEDARQNYSQQQYQDLRMQQIKAALEQQKAQRNALMLQGPLGAQQSGFVSPPQAITGSAPAAPLQSEAPLQSPQFHLPAGFDSPQQWNDFATAFPEEALKRRYPEQEHGLQSFGAGAHVFDKATQKEVFSVPEKNNPNQPFNVDGTPNAAFQAYKQAEMRQQQAPAWANVQIARDKASRAASGVIEPDTLSFMAQQVLAGDKSPYANIGRGVQGAGNLAALRKEVMTQAQARGLGGADLAALNAEFAGLQAGERTLGTRTANVEMAAAETQQLAPIALAASNRVDRSRYPSFNKIELAVKQGTGDENVVRFSQANNALVNTYSRAISPSGTPTVSDKEHAREILETAYSKGQYAAAVDQMQQEIAAARRSPGSVRGEFRGAISGKTGGVAAVPDAPNSPAPKSQMLARPKTPADVAKLKSGTHFIDPNGVERAKP